MPKTHEKPTVPILLTLDQIVPNTYNPKDKVEDNAENLRQYKRIKKSLSQVGQIEAILVREVEGGKYEIINGFHRFKAATELGWQHLRAENFGEISLPKAQMLAMVTEDARVALNKILVSKLILDILAGDVLIAEDLPYDEMDLKAMKELAEFKWDDEDGDDGEEKDAKDKPYSIVLPDSHVTDWNQLKTAKGFQYDTELLVWLIENASV